MNFLAKSSVLLLSLGLLAGCSSNTTTTTNTEDTTQKTEETTTTSKADDTAVKEMLTGSWYSTVNSDTVIEFFSNGTVSDNLTFDEDSVTGYSIGANDALILDVTGEGKETIRRTTDETTALYDDDFYYLDDETLILDEITYSAYQTDTTESGNILPSDNTMASDNALIGTWSSGNSQFTLNADGSVTGDLYYDGERVTAWDAASDGTITFQVVDDDLTEKVFRAENENQALSDDDFYFASGNMLILDGVTYTLLS